MDAGGEGITDSMGMSLSKVWEMVKDREAWRAAVHGVTKSWTRLSDWAIYICVYIYKASFKPINLPREIDRHM